MKATGRPRQRAEPSRFLRDSARETDRDELDARAADELALDDGTGVHSRAPLFVEAFDDDEAWRNAARTGRTL